MSKEPERREGGNGVRVTCTASMMQILKARCSPGFVISAAALNDVMKKVPNPPPSPEKKKSKRSDGSHSSAKLGGGGGKEQQKCVTYVL